MHHSTANSHFDHRREATISIADLWKSLLPFPLGLLILIIVIHSSFLAGFLSSSYAGLPGILDQIIPKRTGDGGILLTELDCLPIDPLREDPVPFGHLDKDPFANLLVVWDPCPFAPRQLDHHLLFHDHLIGILNLRPAPIIKALCRRHHASYPIIALRAGYTALLTSEYPNNGFSKKEMVLSYFNVCGYAAVYASFI